MSEARNSAHSCRPNDRLHCCFQAFEEELARVGMSRLQLPIDYLLPEVVGYVQRNTITLLEAEPAAGKTTRVPPALLNAGFREVYVLEPRRLAARLAARRVAEELGESVGGTVGYQVRFEEVSSRRTRLWYLTEGILTRKLLSDRTLAKATVVVLDEFHERHLETDLSLALLRNIQKTRPDLRLLLMSATLSGEDLAAKLGNAPVIRAPGRVFPVTVRYTPHSPAPLEEQVASVVSKALVETGRHILVFLPGAAEIRRAITACEAVARQNGANVLPLYGDLSPAEQDAAVAPSRQRKIICSTNVAESSITIEGVEAVVDSGLARIMTHSPWSGLSRLRIEKISRSSAIQRAGRAGRTGPGLAIRLFSESDFVRRPEQAVPEILSADLTQLRLQLAASGIHWDHLEWLEAPSAEMREHADELLLRLGALNEDQKITESGRAMAGLPIHPRLARFVLQARQMGAGQEACEFAAQLSEGRVRTNEDARGNFASDIDLVLSEDLSYSARRLMQQLLASTKRIHPSSNDSHALEKALLLAYPDRVTRRRGETLLLSNGGSAKLARSSLVHSEFLVAVEIDDRSDRTAPLVRIASSIEPDWLLDFFPDRIKASEEILWNREAERIEQVNRLRYDELIVDESRSAPAGVPSAAGLLAAKALEAGVERFTEAEELERFLRRVRFAAQHTTEFKIPEDLLASALQDLATGLTSFAELREAGKNGALLALLQSKLPMRLIDEIAPAYVHLPNGRRAKIEYHDGRAPSIASRLQDFFGMKESPVVARGAVPLVVELLAPNRRPVQVTTDLASFWKNLYPQVRRELSRRYPKHPWPPD
jgi:ATP-dependent helicase HrpB